MKHRKVRDSNQRHLKAFFVVANLIAGASCWRATTNATLATCRDVITFFPSSISTPATFTSLRTCQVGSFGCLFLELCQDGWGWWGGCCVNCELAALCELNIQMKAAVTGARVWMWKRLVSVKVNVKQSSLPPLSCLMLSLQLEF